MSADNNGEAYDNADRAYIEVLPSTEESDYYNLRDTNGLQGHQNRASERDSFEYEYAQTPSELAALRKAANTSTDKSGYTSNVNNPLDRHSYEALNSQLQTIQKDNQQSNYAGYESNMPTYSDSQNSGFPTPANRPVNRTHTGSAAPIPPSRDHLPIIIPREGLMETSSHSHYETITTSTESVTQLMGSGWSAPNYAIWITFSAISCVLAPPCGIPALILIMKSRSLYREDKLKSSQSRNFFLASVTLIAMSVIFVVIICSVVPFALKSGDEGEGA